MNTMHAVLFFLSKGSQAFSVLLVTILMRFKIQNEQYAVMVNFFRIS
jgi:hypothetical protein